MEPEEVQCSPCLLTLRSVIKDTNQSETPEASPTPLLPPPISLSHKHHSDFALLILPPLVLLLLVSHLSLSPLQLLYLAHATQLCQVQPT